MSQNAIAIPVVGVYSGTAAAGYINDALDTLATKQSGSSAPTGPALGWDWLDTSIANQATWKVYDGAQWLVVGTIDITNHRWSPPIGGGQDTIASATTTDIGSKYQSALTISGVTAITGFGASMVVGAIKFITHSGALLLTHHATDLILPTGANITTAVGDSYAVQCIASGKYRVHAYQKADGSPLVYSGNVTGSFQLSGVLAPASIGSSPQDDYGPTNFATNTIWRLSSSVDAIITGIQGGTSGRLLVLVNTNAFGGKTITLPIEATTSTAGNRFAGNVPIVLRPGESRMFEYDNTSSRWRAVNNVQSGGAWASFKKLSVTNNSGTPNSILDVAADELILEDTDGNTLRLTAVAQSPNMGTSGAGGLDTGAEANSTWYSVWIIYNAITSTVSSLFSLSATAPTMPSGYTFKMRVGWVRNDGSSNFLRFMQFGRRVQYTIVAATNTAAMPLIASGAAGTDSPTAPVYTTASIATFVPTTATEIFLVVTQSYNNASVSNVTAAPNTAYSGVASTNIPPLCMRAGANVAVAFAALILETTTIAWCSSAAGGGVFCNGWLDNI